jgi:Glyoxalase/Bleomycin resistance protein/Dioxygenase superfamily
MRQLYHIGILVPDLDAAVDHYAALYGTRFRPPIEVTAGRVTQKNGSDAAFTCRLTYSAGPMHVELLQATGDGLWSPQNVGGIHHVGMWSEDPVADSKALLAAGAVWEASMYLAPEMVGVVFVRHRGVLVELVTEQLRTPLLDWIEGRRAHVM